jgi:hypothetical protein
LRHSRYVCHWPEATLPASTPRTKVATARTRPRTGSIDVRQRSSASLRGDAAARTNGRLRYASTALRAASPARITAPATNSRARVNSLVLNTDE